MAEFLRVVNIVKEAITPDIYWFAGALIISIYAAVKYTESRWTELYDRLIQFIEWNEDDIAKNKVANNSDDARLDAIEDRFRRFEEEKKDNKGKGRKPRRK